MEGRAGKQKSRRLTLPQDYLTRVYAGVLGKLIGVYMGRPFEGWTHQRILAELGHVRYFVNERLGVPVVVTDDDVSGTFTFVRALEEHQPALHGAEDVARTWLNNIIKGRTVFWWGGNGVSTEHTAFLNLKKGIRPPMSGSMKTNGRAISEQIGAQIFIDGFAMTVPGQPAAAAMLAGSAAAVSHDGDALAAARMWAAMEAEAFLSDDVDHLLDTGMRFMASHGLIRTAINDVRSWCKEDKDWLKTRQRIENNYGYHKFPGFCHVIPNHAIMVMALIYAGPDFGEAMHIVNTCGWDTDCNSGNLGCLIAIMKGLAAFDDGADAGKVRGGGGRLDWRGPLADRALISSADGGYSINNAARIAFDIMNMGRRNAGEKVLPPPKNHAQFHFSLPGSVQGFRDTSPAKKQGAQHQVIVKQGIDAHGMSGLAIRIPSLEVKGEAVEVTTDTFAPPEVREMETYELVCSPLVYPGQTLKALVMADATNTVPARVSLMLRAYTFKDELETFTGSSIVLKPGIFKDLSWIIPTSLGCRPIQAVGLSISHGSDTQTQPLIGTIWLDHLTWGGIPKLTLLPIDISDGPRTFYKQSFVNAADDFGLENKKFVVAQDKGEGLVTYGTREWNEYRAVFKDFVITGDNRNRLGVAFKINGLRRFYALYFAQMRPTRRGVLMCKVIDEKTFVLRAQMFNWLTDVPYTIVVDVKGDHFSAFINNTNVRFDGADSKYPGGGVGLLTTDGSVLVGSIEIREPYTN